MVHGLRLTDLIKETTYYLLTYLHPVVCIEDRLSSFDLPIMMKQQIVLYVDIATVVQTEIIGVYNQNSRIC